MIITVFSIAPYLTDKGEHTALYEINSDVYISYCIITVVDAVGLCQLSSLYERCKPLVQFAVGH